MGRSAKNHLQMAHSCFVVLFHLLVAQTRILVVRVGTAPTSRTPLHVCYFYTNDTMAEVVGFEPTNTGVKVLRLTT